MRIAVVTGGTRGIGRAVAGRLAADGFSVIAAARHAPVLHEAALPDGVRFVACDVADIAQVKALFADLTRVDVLVTAAGHAGTNPLVADDPGWAEIIASNLHGTWDRCMLALEKMPDRAGRIVTISSVLGLRAVPDQPAYCAAKHGVIGLTKSLALAVASRGITVNAVCPGWVDTDMAQARFTELGIDAAAAARGVPLARIASAEDVAAAVAFLLSPAAGHITGHALPVDGGGLAMA